MENLKVGDVLFAKSSYHGLDKVTVRRVTRTQAILDENGYIRIKIDGDRQAAIGSTGWNRTYYSRYTEDLEQEYQKQQLVRQIEDIHLAYSRMELQDLEEIAALLDRMKEKYTTVKA